ncbi:MAG: Stp1/IreP family PP2C-type Ser/Thr phosphatase [Candidatus Nitrotoga sp.]
MDIEQALEIVGQTHPGVVRTHNEDSVAYDASSGLVVLADGMGGHNAGEIASGITVSLITTEIKHDLESMRPEDRGEGGEDVGVMLLREKVQKANASIYNASQCQSQYSGMGTTVVAGLFYDNRLAVAHVGDSRMYRLRGEVFEAITRDHSLLQEQIDRGMLSQKEARLSKNKNLITRAVGVDPEVEIEIQVYAVQVGDIYLLCSDGLNDMVEDDEIGSTVQMLRANLQLMAKRLIEMANDNNGRDNVSVILIKINGEFAVPRGWLAKMLSWFKN